MPQRRYSDKEKAEALAFLDANRGNFKATARQTLIPAQTIKNWDMGRGAGEEVTSLVPQKRADIADRLKEAVHLMLDGVPSKIDEASLRDTFTSIGIGVDKIALLTDLANGISPDSPQPEGQGRAHQHIVKIQYYKPGPPQPDSEAG